MTYEFQIRPAEQEDAHWISGLMQVSARDGHFAQQPSDIYYYAMVVQIVMRGFMSRTTERNGQLVAENIKAKIFIANCQGVPASFLLITEREPGSEDLELYLTGTLNTYKRRGLARALLDYVIAKPGRYYARCYKKSTYAMQLLESRGFDLMNTRSSGTREYCMDI